MKLENQNILIVSNEPWSDIWFSKHNYAWELSKKNNVWFINSPSKWKLSNLFNLKPTETTIHDRLKVLSLQNRFPSGSPFLKRLNNQLASRKICRHLEKQGFADWMLWSFTPLFLFDPAALRAKFSLFHVVDQNWTTFYGAEILAKQADGLIFVSEHILPEYAFTSKNKIVVEHGISEDEFLFDKHKLSLVETETKPFGRFGLYVGVIDKRFDFKLFARITQVFSDITFVIVGPVTISEDHPFRSLFNGSTKNVICLGKKPYKELKYYIKQSHFCISPMDLSYSGNDISHHKTLSYLAQGKPIFSPAFKAYLNIRDLMYLNNEPEATISAMKNYLNNGENDKLAESRIEVAKQHLYSNHLQKIERFINEINFGTKS
jgi:hypothetical protein